MVPWAHGPMVAHGALMVQLSHGSMVPSGGANFEDWFPRRRSPLGGPHFENVFSKGDHLSENQNLEDGFPEGVPSRGTKF